MINVGQQLKKYRIQQGYSQEVLAEKLYVSRQTISNWENNKSLPDIHNLLMMCSLFNVSLDDLVKGDVYQMDREVVRKEMNKWTWCMLVTFVIAAVLIGPMIHYFSWLGLFIILILYMIGLFASIRIDRLKYKHNMKNADRIIAFMNGEDPNKVQVTKKRELFTSALAFICFVGSIMIIVLASLWLTDVFL
nr:helix-turn-helix transcriptional regulator [Staphylococcus lugdunensis]